MAITSRQERVSDELGGSSERFESKGQESEMTHQTQMRGAARFILQSRSKLLIGLRLVPMAAMLFGVASMAPSASATSCYQPSNIAVNGGTVSNSTTLDLSADGGIAVSNANGGDNNIAVGGNGGIIGNGGDAAAGNGGVAVAEANGGSVTIGDINSGGNVGNTVVVQGTQGGNVAVDGGTVTNETTIDISADGGTAVANADGGDGNIAVGGTGGIIGDGGDAAAGNGGVASSEANGGTITVGDVNSGGNSGNTVIVGS
jgi:hypothetical protein